MHIKANGIAFNAIVSESLPTTPTNCFILKTKFSQNKHLLYFLSLIRYYQSLHKILILNIYFCLLYDGF